MRQQAKKKRRAKFSGRKRSVRGYIGLGINVLAIMAYIVMINIAFVKEGNAKMFIGSIGLLAVLGVFIGTILDILALGEEDVYKLIPIVGTVIGVVGILIGVGIYVIGILY